MITIKVFDRFLNGEFAFVLSDKADYLDFTGELRRLSCERGIYPEGSPYRDEHYRRIEEGSGLIAEYDKYTNRIWWHDPRQVFIHMEQVQYPRQDGLAFYWR